LVGEAKVIHADDLAASAFVVTAGPALTMLELIKTKR
jgi:hypothetical protein